MGPVFMMSMPRAFSFFSYTKKGTLITGIPQSRWFYETLL